MQTSNTSPAKKVIVGLVLGAGILFGISSTACTATVTVTCNGGLLDCNGDCVNIDTDPYNCGGCGLTCSAGDLCDQGACVTGTCLADNSSCTYDGECCSYYCASDGACGCIPGGNSGCIADSDCCSNFCDIGTGVCQ